jgi:hypothetical protein
MGKKYRLLISIFLLLLANSSWAGAGIGFGSTTLSADTLSPNDSLIIYTSLVNYRPQAFNGPVGFNYAINGVQNVSRAIFNSPIMGQTINILPGDSLPLQLHVSVQVQYLITGGDIFVVWPIVPDGNNVLDSLFVHLIVRDPDPSALQNEGAAPALKMFYLNQCIQIDNANNIPSAQLRIFDIAGKLVYTGPLPSGHTIPFSNEDTGVYLVEVTFTSGEQRIFKVLKP